MVFENLFQKLMSQFPDIRHFQMENSFAPPTNNGELGSPFQPETYDFTSAIPEPYNEGYFSNSVCNLVKQESPWSSDERSSAISTPFAKRSTQEQLPETPVSNYDQQSQNYVHSATSLRSASSLTKMSSNNSRVSRKIIKPLVATVFWEEEKSVCYQVKANGIVVSRKGSDDFVNGTKLLNVTGMSRGRRDGILKVEKGRRVIRNGSMNLKGVWIPYDRALEIARNEGIKDLLYPLFVKDIYSFYKEKGQRLREELDDDQPCSDQ